MSDHRKKLIEVALPLEEINHACRADKGRAHGTLKNVHKWFAPMPLPAWRVLLYAAAVDDPGDDEARSVHLDLMRRLVERGADAPEPHVVDQARQVLATQFPDGLPLIVDPFCGGGSTLVEAQRLGFPAFGSDLNPVPTLITRTLTNLVPPLAGRPPLHASIGSDEEANLDLPMEATSSAEYPKFTGLERDVLYYANWIRLQAWQRIGQHFPSRDGESVIAWLWARTMTCPNPACGVETILTTSWWLSKKPKERAWIQPRVDNGRVHLDVVTDQSTGSAPESPKAPRGALFTCIGCQSPITEEDMLKFVEAKGLGLRMTAVVSEMDGKRVYREPTAEDILATSVSSHMLDIPDNVPASDGGKRNRFGMNSQADLYTTRQLLTLTTFADLVRPAFDQVLRDGGDLDWARAIAAILGLGIGRQSQFSSSQARWTVRDNVSSFEAAFPRNDLPVTWDFYEINVFAEAGPSWMQAFRSMLRGLAMIPIGASAEVIRHDARSVSPRTPAAGALVATDPPYFDAIGYADLSDYFYVWHRRALRFLFDDLYGTVASPKTGELTALAVRHSEREVAQRYFIEGFSETFANLSQLLGPGLPMLVVYASKEQKGGREEETRWSSILTAMVNAELEITGTWPILGTTDRRMIGQGTNAVATYVVMVARPRAEDAGTCSLVEFNRILRRELGSAVRDLQAAGVLPVDLAQAAIGPGMQVYSRYRAVLDQSGRVVSVEQALRLINQAKDEVLEEQDSDLDPDSRFAIALWERHHWDEAPFGEADQLARPQGISVDDVVRARVAVYPRKGFVRLVGLSDIDRNWIPANDSRPTAWEAVHHLADRLIEGGGVEEAGRLMAELGSIRDQAQALVYRLHAIAARQGWTQDQERYNSLIGSWSDLIAEASQAHGGDGLF